MDRQKGQLLTLNMRTKNGGAGAKRCNIVGLREGPIERSRTDWRMCHMSRVDPASINKCNIFVYHKAGDAGATVPLTRGGIPGYRTSPPLAYDWWDVSYGIDGWTHLSNGSYPQPGYVISRPDSSVLPGGVNEGQRYGHVGILDY